MVDGEMTGEAVVAMLLFSLASSSLLLVNKLVLHHLPAPSLVSTLQFVSSVVSAVAVMASGRVKPDYFEWRKVKPYLLYVGMFVRTLFPFFRPLIVTSVSPGSADELLALWAVLLGADFEFEVLFQNPGVSEL